MTSDGLFITVLALAVLTGCGGPFSSNRNVLPDSTFTRVLTELHLAAARRKLKRPYPAGLRDSVFAHYSVDAAAFDTTLRYYSRRPQAFKALYRPIIDTLKSIQYGQSGQSGGRPSRADSPSAPPPPGRRK